MLITCVMRNARAHKFQWSGPTVHSSTVLRRCCSDLSICSPLKEAWPLLAKGGDFKILKAWKQVFTTSEREFHKQRVIKIVGNFVFLKIGKVGEKIKQSYM